jgi:hypothetical protein
MKWEPTDEMKGTGRMKWNERKQENRKKISTVKEYLK